MRRLGGRVAIVTGGAGVIGKAYCHGFAAEGAYVVVADLESPDDVVAALQNAGHEALGVDVDVSDPDSTKEMAQQTLAEYGRIDILVNNAAFFRSVTRGPFEDIPVSEWDTTMAVNVRGPLVVRSGRDTPP